MGLIGWIKARFSPAVDAKPAEEHARSPHWPTIRKSWLATHSVCRACGGTDSLEVHHKQPFHLNPARELDLSNLITLCERPGRNCHLTWGHFYNWKKFNPHVETDTTDWQLKQERARS